MNRVDVVDLVVDPVDVDLDLDVNLVDVDLDVDLVDVDLDYTSVNKIWLGPKSKNTAGTAGGQKLKIQPGARK